MRKRTRRARNQVRIIAGTWRGRRIRFPDNAGLRPTSDRNRETLFNWLMPDLPGARCLDLFAGSGALGFEAASRGAHHVVLVEQAQRTVAALRESAEQLDAKNVVIQHESAERYLAGSAEPFHIVWIDPPFDQARLRETVCCQLEGGWLAPDALIYLELPTREAPVVPPAWRPIRTMRSGDAVGMLYRVQATPQSAEQAEAHEQ